MCNRRRKEWAVNGPFERQEGFRSKVSWAEREEEKETTANRIEGKEIKKKERKRGKQLFNFGGRNRAVKLTLQQTQRESQRWSRGWLQTSSGQQCPSQSHSLALAPADRAPPWCLQVSRLGEEGSGGQALEAPSHPPAAAARLRNTRRSSSLVTGTSPPGNLSYLSDTQGDLNIAAVTGFPVLKVRLLCWQLGS